MSKGVKHLVVLADVLGTKAALTNPDVDQSEFQEKFKRADRILIDVLSEYFPRSQSLSCLAFSDSYILNWDDIFEGRRYVSEICDKLYKSWSAAESPVRIFAALSPKPDFSEDRFSRYEQSELRLSRFTPVSLAVWSVFLAESKHFGLGVYFDLNLATLLGLSTLVTCSVPPFQFVKMKYSVQGGDTNQLPAASR